MKVFIITKRIEHRDWGEITFDVLGVWPTFEAAKEELEKMKREHDDFFKTFHESKTMEVESRDNRAWWRYSNWEGHYSFNVESVEYHDK